MSNLFEAVKNGDAELLERLSREKQSDDDLRGALRNAAESGRLTLVKILTRHGARDDWAVVAAASFADAKTVDFLARLGGNIDAAFIGAAAHGRLDNARCLAAFSPSPTARDEALADAALRGYVDVARFLLDGGADPDAVVWGGKTAAGIAMEKGDAALIRLFADSKAEKTLKTASE